MAKRRPTHASVPGTFAQIRQRRRPYSEHELASLLSRVDRGRFRSLAGDLSGYIQTNLAKAFKKRGGLAAYRISPYVLMASAGVVKLGDPLRLAEFIFNNKLYAGLETSFGKSIERLFIRRYPIARAAGMAWAEPIEKLAEFGELAGLDRQARARIRNSSAWREIDSSCVVGERRYLLSIKSGPNCINDTQVAGMTTAIAQHYREWLRRTRSTYPAVQSLDIVIGVTYGTDRTTNNKENQILVKLLEHGFAEEDPVGMPGVLVDGATRQVRVYRAIGQDFWSIIGNPASPADAAFVFVEVLLAIAKGLADGLRTVSLHDQLAMKLAQLSAAFQQLVSALRSEDLPAWAATALSADELFWFSAALTAFYDEGI